MSSGHPNPTELIGIVAPPLVMDEFYVQDGFKQPTYSRQALMEIMVHERPASREEDDYNLRLEDYLEQVHLLAELSLAGTSAAITEKGVSISAMDITRQVGGIVCAHEAATSQHLMRSWLDYYSGEYLDRDYSFIRTSAVAADGLFKRNFDTFMELSGGKPDSTLKYWGLMRSSIDFTMLTVMQRYEQWINNNSELA
jgi:hypothetical protein